MRNKVEKQGAGYLVRNYKEKSWCPYVINEGGGLAFPSKKGYVFPIQTAEKGILWLKIKAKGTPGHGSTPNMADNAVMRMNKVIDKLANYKPPTIYVPTLKQFLLTWQNKTRNWREALHVYLQIPMKASRY